MIHCDERKIIISGTVSEIMTDLTEIITEMVVEGILDQDGTTIQFNTSTTDRKTIEELLAGAVVTVSKYGGN